jgi:hypothetical protein
MLVDTWRDCFDQFPTHIINYEAWNVAMHKTEFMENAASNPQ